MKVIFKLGVTDIHQLPKERGFGLEIRLSHTYVVCIHVLGTYKTTLSLDSLLHQDPPSVFLPLHPSPVPTVPSHSLLLPVHLFSPWPAPTAQICSSSWLLPLTKTLHPVVNLGQYINGSPLHESEISLNVGRINTGQHLVCFLVTSNIVTTCTTPICYHYNFLFTCLFCFNKAIVRIQITNCCGECCCNWLLARASLSTYINQNCPSGITPSCWLS